MPPGKALLGRCRGKAGGPVLPGSFRQQCRQEEWRERVTVSESQVHAGDQPENAPALNGQADESGRAEEAGPETAGAGGEPEAAQAEAAQAAGLNQDERYALTQLTRLAPDAAYLERLNELQVYWNDAPTETKGFTDVLVTEPHHPMLNHWWPPGHIIGWEHTFVHELAHLLDAIANNKPVEPYCATFEDGYKAAVIADALLRSAEIGEFIDLNY